MISSDESSDNEALHRELLQEIDGIDSFMEGMCHRKTELASAVAGARSLLVGLRSVITELKGKSQAVLRKNSQCEALELPRQTQQFNVVTIEETNTTTKKEEKEGKEVDDKDELIEKIKEKGKVDNLMGEDMKKDEPEQMKMGKMEQVIQKDLEQIKIEKEELEQMKTKKEMTKVEKMEQKLEEIEQKIQKELEQVKRNKEELEQMKIEKMNQMKKQELEQKIEEEQKEQMEIDTEKKDLMDVMNKVEKLRFAEEENLESSEAECSNISLDTTIDSIGKLEDDLSELEDNAITNFLFSFLSDIRKKVEAIFEEVLALNDHEAALKHEKSALQDADKIVILNTPKKS